MSNNKKRIIKNKYKSDFGYDYIIPLTPSEKQVLVELSRDFISKDEKVGAVYLYKLTNQKNKNIIKTEICAEVIHGAQYFFTIHTVEAIVYLNNLYDLDLNNYEGVENEQQYN